MPFKRTPPELHLAQAMGDWLTLEEVLALAAKCNVTIDNDLNKSSAAYELILAIRGHESHMAMVEAEAEPLIREREEAAHAGSD